VGERVHPGSVTGRARVLLTHLWEGVAARVTPGRPSTAQPGLTRPDRGSSETPVGDERAPGAPAALLLADQLVGRLRADLPPAIRLRLRTHPALDALADALALARLTTGAMRTVQDLHRMRADIRDHGQDGQSQHSQDSGSLGQHGRDREIDRARGRIFAMALDLAGVLAEARVLARGLAARDDPGLRRAGALADLLDRAGNHALDLGRDHSRRRGDAVAHRLDRDLARVNNEAPAVLRTATIAVAAAAGIELGPGPRTRPDQAPAVDAAAVGSALIAARTDFTDMDLSGADLSEVDLRGVVWSVGTRWPAEWADWLRRESVEIAPDVFEVPASWRPDHPSR